MNYRIDGEFAYANEGYYFQPINGFLVKPTMVFAASLNMYEVVEKPIEVEEIENPEIENGEEGAE